MGVAASILGAIIWAAHFGVIYGGQAVACAAGRPGLVPPIVIGSSAVALVLLLVAVGMAWRHRHGFMGAMAIGIAALSALAIVWEAAPALALPSC